MIRVHSREFTTDQIAAKIRNIALDVFAMSAADIGSRETRAGYSPGRADVSDGLAEKEVLLVWRLRARARSYRSDGGCRLTETDGRPAGWSPVPS